MIEFRETMFRNDSMLPLQIGFRSTVRVTLRRTSLKSDRAWVVEGDDEFDARERDVEPPPVRRVEHPPFTCADRVDPPTLLEIRHRNPAGLPREVIHRMPRNSRGRGDAFCERRLARPRDAVDEYPVGHGAKLACARRLRGDRAEIVERPTEQVLPQVEQSRPE